MVDLFKKKDNFKVSKKEKAQRERLLADETDDVEPDPIKAGEYQIQVHVIEAKDLKGRDSSGMSDPVTVVEIMGQRRSTVIKKETLSCIWNQLLFFDFHIEDPAELEAGRINLTVNDANMILSDTLIGTYELDCMYVWKRERHELYKQWVALSDVTDQHEGIQGYLKVSIVIIGPGEEPPTHNEEEEDGGDGSVLMSPNIELEGYALHVFPALAEDLPKLDNWGAGIDAYTRIMFAGNPPVTTKVKSDTNPKWLEEVKVPVLLPAMTDKVEIGVWDNDLTNSHSLAGTTFVSFRHIMKNPEVHKIPRWYNLYGCPPHADHLYFDRDGKKKKAMMMNVGRYPGTWYRGRLLLSFAAKKEDEPKMSSPGDVTYNDEDKHARIPEVEQYCLRIQLYEATELPTRKHVVVFFRMGPHVIESPVVQCHSGCCHWYDEKRIEDVAFKFPKDIDQIPDLFVDVHEIEEKPLKGMQPDPNPENRMSQIRLKVSDLKAFNAAPTWQILTADPHGTLGSGQFPGFLLLSCGFGKQRAAVRRRDLPRPPLRTYQLRAHIYQGRDLPPADETGTCDPYCVVRCAGARAQTHIKDKTRFPVWYQTLTMEVRLPQPIALAPDVNVLVYDHDEGVTADDDLLGRVTIDIGDIKPEMPDQPKWHPVYLERPELPEGELLCSFQLLSSDAVPPPTRQPIPSLLPATKDCAVEIIVLGLRDLADYGLQSIQNPHVTFDMGDATHAVKTKKSKRPSGKNPNFVQMLKLPARLPLDALFAPVVNVNVYDNRNMNMETVLIGTTTIPLEDFLPWVEKEVVVKERKGFIYGQKDKPIDKLLKTRAEIRGQAGEAVGHLKEEAGAAMAEAGEKIISQARGSMRDLKEHMGDVKDGLTDVAAIFDDSDSEDDKPKRRWKDVVRRKGRKKDYESTEGGESVDARSTTNTEDAEGKNKETANGPNGPRGKMPLGRLKTKLGKGVPGSESATAASESGKSSKKGEGGGDEETKSGSEKDGESEEEESDFDDDDDSDATSEPSDDDDAPKFLRGRWRFDDELEDQFQELPFQDFSIQRGQARGRSYLDELLGRNAVEFVGKLKGLVRVYEDVIVDPKEKKRRPPPTVGGIQTLEEKKQQIAPKAPPPPINMKEFSNPKPYTVRLYVLRGMNLVPMDAGGTSDPYLVVRCGNIEFNDVENKKEETLQPEFRRCFEFETMIPGDSQLKIDVYDHDLIGSDDLIGSTVIDLENYWFSDEWQQFRPKPVECRSLWNPISSVPQGKLELWVDIIAKNQMRLYPKIDITLLPPEEFEMRLIVFKARKMACMDTLTDQNDLFITATLEAKKREGGVITQKEETDVHWRAKDGKGSFNYRLIFNFELPLREARLKLQAWDKDVIGSNEAIGETTLYIQNELRKALYNSRKQKAGLSASVFYPAPKKRRKKLASKSTGFLSNFLIQDDPSHEWVQLTHTDYPDDVRGEIEIQFEILPAAEARKRKAGVGQEAPNMNPVLPPPDRIALNFFRPDQMLKELLGPELCYKLAILSICGMCGSCLMVVGPQLMVFFATLSKG